MTNPPHPVGRVSPPRAPPHSPARIFLPRLRPTRVAQATRLSRSATRRPERNETPYCLRQIAAFIVYRPSMQPRPRPHDQKIHPMTNPPHPVGRVSPPGAPPHRKIHLTTNPPPLTRTFHPRLRPTRVAQATRLSRFGDPPTGTERDALLPLSDCCLYCLSSLNATSASAP